MNNEKREQALAEVRRGMTKTEISLGIKKITFTREASSLLGMIISEGIHDRHIEKHPRFKEWNYLAKEGKFEEIPGRLRIREVYPESPFDFVYPKAYFEDRYRLAG